MKLQNILPIVGTVLSVELITQNNSTFTPGSSLQYFLTVCFPFAIRNL
jgi:hypothetical protein